MSDVNNEWRMTAYRVKFFFVDSRASVVVPIFFIHMRPTTAVVVVGILAIFALLERRGYTVDVAIRMFRETIASLFRRTLVVRHRPPMWRYFERAGI